MANHPVIPWQFNVCAFRGPPVDIFELTSSSASSCASPPHFFDNVFMLSASRNWLTKESKEVQNKVGEPDKIFMFSLEVISLSLSV